MNTLPTQLKALLYRVMNEMPHNTGSMPALDAEILKLTERPRCATCVRWDEKSPDSGICTSSKLIGGGYLKDALMCCEGGYFWTGPQFGCVHHEAKPG